MKFQQIVPEVNIRIFWRSRASIWRHTFKMPAMTLFHAEKCCHLVSTHAASLRRTLLHMQPAIATLYAGPDPFVLIKS